MALNLLSLSIIITVAVAGVPLVTLYATVASAGKITAAKLSGSVGTGTTAVLLPLNAAVKRPLV